MKAIADSWHNPVDLPIHPVASLMITSHRGRLESDVVEYTQCTKNRLRNGVISPQVLTGTRDGGIDDEETIHID
jgi:hypothetical protein